MSGVMMLNHLYEAEHVPEYHAAAEKIKAAYNTLLANQDAGTLTRDLGGRAGTREFTKALIKLL
jgi:isocitrate/isopropylmalate dehydrogenase